MFKNIDALIFDLDGTLWDSRDTVVNSWNQVFKENNKNIIITKEGMTNCMGMLMSDIANKLFIGLTNEEQKEFLSLCCDKENQDIAVKGGILYDNLEETLIYLSNKYKLFIVSNCQSGYIEVFFKAHNLEKYFTDYEDPGRTSLPKAENIKLVIKRNNLINPVYIGDTQGDYNSATLAGIPFIYASYGFGKVTNYNYKLDSIFQLKSIF